MTTTAHAQIVTFRLGDELFAADIHAVERVLRYVPPRAIPNVPVWVEGVVDYHGRVVPVIDLRRRFELPAPDARDGARILVFNVGAEWIAASVDAVLDVSGVADGAVVPPPPFFRGLAGEYLGGLVRRGDRLVLLIDAARLLSATERLALDACAPDDAAAITAPADVEVAGRA